MRRGICGFSLNNLGLLSNFKSVRLNILLKKLIIKFILLLIFFLLTQLIEKMKVFIVSKIRSGPFLVSITGDEGFNLTLSR
jgi:hypothetical protein